MPEWLRWTVVWLMVFAIGVYVGFGVAWAHLGHELDKLKED